MSETKKENIQFRILYFIGMILIVANHCGGGSFSFIYEWFPAYSFHLALFVFASGYFFVNNKGKKIFPFIKKILLKFIVPLYAWNLIYGLIVFVLHKFGFTIGYNLSIDSLLILPLWNGHQFAFNLATWFIVPLFIIQLINIFLIKLMGDRNKFYYIHFIISLLFGFFGVSLAMKGYNQGAFLLLDKVLYFIPFFSLGMLYRVNIEKYDKSSNLVYFGVLFAITLIVIYLFGGVKSYKPSWCNDFDNFYRPFFAGVLGICFWLRVSKILVPVLKNSKIVSLISKNSFSIMIHHFTGFFILNTLWGIAAKIFNFIEGFDFIKYKSSIWYRYIPKGLKQFELLYLIFGIGFSLLLIFILDKTKIFIKSKLKKAN